jgi:hypothetical protein
MHKFAGNKIEKNEMGGSCSSVGEGRGVYRVLVEKSEGKRPRRRWVDNIKMDLQVVGCGGMDWIDLAQGRQVVGTCEYGNESPGSIKCGEFLD